MQMVLQYQTVKRGSDGLYSGEATYLTELLFEQTDYPAAEQSVRENVDQTGAVVATITMTIDGNSGKWGCTIAFKKATAPMPLALGVDLDSPQAIYDYYINYAERVIHEHNDEIAEIIGITEKSDCLALRVCLADGSMDNISIPYPNI